MPYIGALPDIGSFTKLDAISAVNGQAAYTMQKNSVNFSPASVNQMLVSLNGVIQSPGSSFTISAHTLTFASNLSTGDVIDFIIVYGDVLNVGTVSDATITNDKLATAPTLISKGAGSDSGAIQLNCEVNTHGVKIKGPPHSAAQSYTLTLPSTAPAANKMLQSDGSGNLSFVDTPSGSLVKIASGNTTGGSVSYVDVAGCFTSTYKIYKLYIYDVNTASDTALYMRWLTGSSTEQAGSNAYHYGISGYNSSNGGSNNGGVATYMNLIGEDIRQNADEQFALEGTIYNPTGTTLKTRFNYHTGGRRTGNYTVVGTGSAEWNSATAVTGFRFLTNTGNLDSMYYVVYGLVI